MRSSLRSLAIVAALSALFFARSAVADKPDASYHRMKKAQVIDQYGFEKPLPAITMLIPSDWKMEGVVNYPKGGSGCGAEMYKLGFRATSPDGLTALELYPPYHWQWADAPQSRQMMMSSNQQNARFGTPPCDIMQPMSAANFIGKLAAPKIRPGAKVISVEPIPDANEAVQNEVQQAQQQANAYGIQARFSGDHARAHISYELKGKPVEEWLTAVLTVRAAPSPVFANGRMQQTVGYNISARRLFAMRAPAGQLEANQKLFRLIISTMRIESEWAGRVGQVQQNIAAIKQKGESDRQKIRQKSAEDVNAIRQSGVAHQQQVQDETNRRFDQSIRDVETYRDPNTGEKVELSNQYGHAWSNGGGEYILSDSPGFDPNAHLNGSWTKLQQVDH